jgi:hypothetical protein
VNFFLRFIGKKLIKITLNCFAGKIHMHWVALVYTEGLTCCSYASVSFLILMTWKIILKAVRYQCQGRCFKAVSVARILYHYSVLCFSSFWNISHLFLNFRNSIGLYNIMYCVLWPWSPLCMVTDFMNYS